MVKQILPVSMIYTCLIQVHIHGKNYPKLEKLRLMVVTIASLGKAGSEMSSFQMGIFINGAESLKIEEFFVMILQSGHGRNLRMVQAKNRLISHILDLQSKMIIGFSFQVGMASITQIKFGMPGLTLMAAIP